MPASYTYGQAPTGFSKSIRSNNDKTLDLDFKVDYRWVEVSGFDLEFIKILNLNAKGK